MNENKNKTDELAAKAMLREKLVALKYILKKREKSLKSIM